MKVYSVKFKEQGKSYYFNGNDDYKIDDYVIVETEKGLQYGKISGIISTDEEENSYKNIIRYAQEEDKEEYLKLLNEASGALEKCKSLVATLGLNMHVLSAEFTFDRTQLLFNFTSDERVDFRELAKRLAGIYHTRIELRQIGARDKAKEIGGIGICGGRICCSRFLNHIDAISMNMAKNQNLALNPSKINGLCGRLLCCLQYEDDNYLECSKGLPSVGDTINTPSGEGSVVSVDVLNRKCKVLVGSNKEEVDFNENTENSIE